MLRSLLEFLIDLKISEESRLNRYDLWALCALATLILALFSGNLLTGTYPVDPFWIEIAQTHMPVKTFYAHCIQMGRFPLLCPNVGLGYTTLAHTHGYFFYLPSWIFMKAAFLTGMAFYIIFHLLLLGVSVYFLFRAFGSGAWGSFIGSAMMSLGGYFIFNMGYVPIFSTACWSPLIILVTARLHREIRIDLIIALALISTIQFMAGDEETIFYQWVVISAGLGLVHIYGIDGDNDYPNPLIALAIVGAIAGILIAAQFIPLLELFDQSERRSGFQLISLKGKLLWSGGQYLKALAMVALPLPMIGHYFNFSVLATSFGIMGWWKSERRFKAISGIIFIFCLVNAVQHVSPLQQLFNYIPVLKGFRFPSRLGVFAQLIFYAWAAIGVDRFFRGKLEVPAWLPVWMAVYGAAGLYAGPSRTSAALVLALAGFAVLGKIFPARVTRMRAMGFIAAVLLADPLASAIASMPRSGPGAMAPYPETLKLFQDNQAPPHPFSRSVIIARGPDAHFNSGEESAWGGYTPANPYSIFPLRYFRFIALLMPDSVTLDKNYENIVSYNHHDFFMHFYRKDLLTSESLPWMELAGIRYLLLRGRNYPLCSPYSLVYEAENGRMDDNENLSPGRAVADTPEGQRLALTSPLGTSMKFHIQYYAGTSLKFGLTARDFKNTADMKIEVFIRSDDGGVMTLLSETFSLTKENPYWEARIDLPFPEKGHGWLYFRSETASGKTGGDSVLEWVDPQLTNPHAPYKRFVSGNVDIYRDDRAYPKAFLPYEPKVFDSIIEVFKYMKNNPGTDFHRVVLLESGSKDKYATYSEPWGGFPEPKIVSYLPDFVKIEADLKGPAYMVLTDNYYPGWRAFENGVETPIIPADGAFRAVEVSPGRKVITMKYVPESFRIGLWTSLAGLLAALMMAIKRMAQGG